MKPQYLQQNYGGDIIELSSALLKEFADATKAPEAKKEDKYVYGTIKNNGESSYVMFDGSDFLTPITSAMGYEDGDRVMVLVKNHKAIVVNNMTSPGVTDKYVKENFASFDNLAATNAQIGYLRANMITSDVLEAKIGEFGYLKASQAEIKYASIEALNAANVEISDLKSSTIKTTELSAEVAKLGYAKITDLNVINGRIDTLESSMITTDNLKAEVADLGLMTADQADIRYLTASGAKLQFADINLANVESASIGTMLAGVGLISDATIQNGHVTGYLDSVEVNADSITAGTLAVDRLIIRGSEKSLVYELNNISGALQSKSVDTLNGEILTPRTITADKLVAKSITANEIAAGTITANEIAAGTITASQINMTNLVGNSAFINAISSNSVVVGLRTDLDGISVGGRNLIVYSKLQIGTLTSGQVLNPSNNRVCTADKISIEPNTQYIFSISNPWKYKGFRMGIHSYDSSGTFIHDTGWYQILDGHNPRIIITQSNAVAIRIVFSFSETTTTPETNTTENMSTVDLEQWKKNVKIKLEKGNKPTDWTPAPEDVDSSISSVKSLADTAQSTANSAVSTIGTWCYNNDITYINGGKIYTGTVTADKLAANSVTAEKILAGAITADKLAVDAITSRNYVKDTSGTKISLADGSYDSKYTKINSEGKIECSDIKITGGNIDLFSSNKDTPKLRIHDGEYTSSISSSEIHLRRTYESALVKVIDNSYMSGDVLQLESVIDDTYTNRVQLVANGHSYLYLHRIDDLSPKIFKYATEIFDDGIRMSKSISESGKETSKETLFEVDYTGNVTTAGDVTTTSGASLNGLNTTVSGLSTSLSSLSTTVAQKQPFNQASSIATPNLNNFYSGVILGSGIPNAPDSDWWLVVSGGVSGTTVQRAYNLWSGRCNWRYCASGNWTAWQASLSCGDISGTGAITIPGNMTSGGVITNALRMPTRTGTQTTAKPNCYIDSGGNFYKTSTASSMSVKDDIKLLESEELNPSRLYDVSIYQFKYKTTYLSNKEDARYRKDMIGFILENLHEKYPIAVDCHMDKSGKIIYDSWNEQYLIPAMLKLIQDQHKRLLKLEKGIQNG